MTVREQVAAAAAQWQPNFKFAESLVECADQINRPHEDYPQRVDATAQLIEMVASFQDEALTLGDCLNLHKILMADRAHIAGKLRTTTVRMRGSGYVPPAPLYIPELAAELFPLVPSLTTDLRQWYSRFQCLHPFDDGNGRVGGILVAGFSKIIYKKYLTPCQ